MNKKEFIGKVVNGYIRKDLEAIETNVPKKPGEAGNVNFPVALCVLAYMEYLGGFLIGEDRGFKQNVDVYINECFTNPDEYKIPILADIFRHGLAHEYFARGGVARDGISPALYRNWNGEVILDADTLLRDFLESLDEFGARVDDDKYESRMKEAEKRLQALKDKNESLIKKLPSIGDIQGARTSGATLPPPSVTLSYDSED